MADIVTNVFVMLGVQLLLSALFRIEIGNMVLIIISALIMGVLYLWRVI
jgi:hypothetical protein